MTLVIPEMLKPVLESRYPRRPRLLFLLRRRSDASEQAFADALGQWRRDRPYGVEAGKQLARAGVAISERQEEVSGRFRPAGADVVPIDGYALIDLEIYAPTAADFESLLQVAAGCLDPLAKVVDLDQSIAIAGVANLPIPGFAPFSMILVLDRAPSLSWLDYNKWWVHHGDDHRTAFPAQAGYHQLHNDPEFNARVAKAAGTTTTNLCITDLMYLGDLNDAFASVVDHNSEEGRRVGAEIGANVSVAKVLGSLFREV